MKNKREFSKVAILILGIVGISQLIVANILMFMVQDISPLAYIIPSTEAVVGIGLSFYFWKAKSENKIKLMKKYGVEPTEESFNDSGV